MHPTGGRTAAAEYRHAGKAKPEDFLITGQIRTPAPAGPATFYTDGSVSRQPIRVGRDKIGHLTGWGYLSTNGRYGCGQAPQFNSKVGKDPAVVAELRAVWYAIGDLIADEPVTVVTDSTHASIILTAWQNGSQRMPDGYTGSTKPTKVPTLEKLRQAVLANPGNLTVDNVKGHAGDVLNEAADTLAMLGMRWARDRLDRDDVARRAEGIADGFLADWRRR